MVERICCSKLHPGPSSISENDAALTEDLDSLNASMPCWGNADASWSSEAFVSLSVA